MEIRQLQYALQIAEERNFSRAAEKLHIAQPSLSQQLSKLEKEIGVLLFQRTTNSVEMTYAGEVFIDRAQKIIDSLEQLKREMSDISQTKTGKVVIGTMPITGSHILPHVVPSFHRRYPDIELVLTEEPSTSNLIKMTAQGKNDFCLLSLPIQEPTLTYEPIVDEEIVISVPHDHPLATSTLEGLTSSHRRPISLQEVRQEPFIFLKKGQGFRQITLEMCRNAGFEPRVVFESSNMETVQSLVAAGMGISLVPSFIASAPRSEFVPAYIPIEGRPARTLVLAYRSGRYMSNAAKAFMQTIKETVAAQFGNRVIASSPVQALLKLEPEEE
ncbi:LysR family transcriptional regulator [Paenibacillus sp. UMB4589-SE434]|uniref:LysR family transcriptional regulator n=1 Tax=Paenibacillus sp. UMB4589-SE434 TaxID=3046314 RepID=UPI00254A9D3B|nr:LysR family transcriptional regulator [Paenibacillus sp. UMB4589-SE434]MDK8179693.1 LysR family transcriptional regulator [Paenibacillus sp. UMB4589-SE434]